MSNKISKDNSAVGLSNDGLRPPICSVIGAVDAGKTTFLDLLRGTSVQDKESGGITQKIGITYLTPEALAGLCRSITGKKLSLDGILLVDTPGHDCFTNQRLTGIEISDLVIVVIDVFKGIEKQTVEILKLLQKNKTPFIVAVNKIDRIHQWFPMKMKSLKASLAKQKPTAKTFLDDKLQEAVIQFAEAGLNAAPYYKNPDPKTFISLVPVSSKTGEGIPDIITVIDLLSKKFLKKKLEWTRTPEQHVPAEGYIIEHIKDQRLGDCLAIILTDGTLNLQHTTTSAVKNEPLLLLQTDDGEVVETQIKTIYIPPAGGEIKDSKLTLQQIQAATNPGSYLIKIHPYADQSTLNVMSGSKFYFFTEGEQELKQQFIEKLTKRYREKQELYLDREFTNPGLYLSAPTLGAIDGLYNLCRQHKIPVSGINIGTLNKKTIIKAKSVATGGQFNLESEDDRIYVKRYLVVLEFSNQVSKDLLQLAERENVTIINHDIIYRLLEQYQQYTANLNNKIKARHPNIAPRCHLKILSQYVFMKKNPILVGVRILENRLISGMTLEATINSKKIILGKVSSIQKNNKTVEAGETHDEVCIKITAIQDKKYE